MMKYLHIFGFLLYLSILNTYSQSLEVRDFIRWNGLIKETMESGLVSEYLSFDGAYTDQETGLPQFWGTVPVKNSNTEITTFFKSMEFEPCSSEESAFLSGIGYFQVSINVTTSISIGRKVPKGIISFIPIRKNPESGVYEKLIFFILTVNLNDSFVSERNNPRSYTANSVLNEGEWYKIKVKQSGIYKISYSELLAYGMNPSAIDPKNIRIYGNGMGMLPEKNSLFRYDDLQENAIYVSGQEDGVFNQNDYILFYGMSPHTWTNDDGFFTYNVNLYDDYNYYFITASLGEGKRLEVEPSVTSSPSHIAEKYNDYAVIEDEKVNLILSGENWYGDIFSTILNREYIFNFPNIQLNEQAVIKLEVANRTLTDEMMAVGINEETFDTLNLTSVSPLSTKYAQKKKRTINYLPSGQGIKIRLDYLPATAASIAWLDYIMINTICHLSFMNGQLLFRDLSSVEEEAVSKFIMTNAVTGLHVWEITNPIRPKIVESTIIDNELTFTLHTDSLREFIAFDGSLFLETEFVEVVENQNLHAEGPFDVIIITHPIFQDYSDQLSALHELRDGFTIKVVTPSKIYNEFSSGKQDPTALRDYIKMFYDKYEGQEPKFLVLFGDGSFDPKDRIENNSNLIPTFQTEESLIKASSYVIDDYFGYLDESEGDDAHGELDIGIGRIPVQTPDEAQIVMNKIERYISTDEPFFGNWRNRICLIADDEDGNLHLEQADSLANQAGLIPALYNKQKIFLDAYTQVQTPSGDRYPDVNKELNEAVNEGALFINYVGHGGKAGWAYERILQTADVINWNNKDRLPVFITASCEFSRFDDPELKTGGELVLLNPEGGGIGLFTTTRLAYSHSNFSLNQGVYLTAFSRIDGEYPYLGDIIQRSKPQGQPTTRNFVLLGDPMLKLAYPSYEVRTLSVKNLQTNQPVDTLRALDMIEISGDIIDFDGNPVNDFNGVVEVILFDKKTRYMTRGNDQYSFPVEFFCQDKNLWQGDATVLNGKFEFSFMVPKDIAYNMGLGKISYYAMTEQFDASGYYNGFTIGGINPNAQTDLVGPEISLYLNNTAFISGDQTHNNPVMLAYLSDMSGINLSAGGIGHEITAFLDDDQSNIIMLNKYFNREVDNYKSGWITYPFYELSDGNHTLTLKAWDNYNNSSMKTIGFVINIHGALELSKVVNFPNPFKYSTTFTFSHTRPGDQLKIELEIFDITGNKVQSYTSVVYSEVTDWPYYVWNGDNVKSGVYLYTLKVTDSDGNTYIQRQKLLKTN